MLHSHYKLNVHDILRLHTCPKLLIRATGRSSSAFRLLLLSKRQARKFIYQCAALLDAARNAAIARGNIHTRVACEEIARSQQQRHRLSRHDGEVFRRWEMCNSECVPQDDISIVKVLVGVSLYPGGDALRRFARGLRDVTACWVELRVIVYKTLVYVFVRDLQMRPTFGDMHCMSRKTRSLPHQTSGLG